MSTPTNSTSPLRSITDEIDHALKARLYFLAILVTLSLPDVCAALESDDGKTSHAKYKAWCDRWIVPAYPMLTSLDIYSLRCGVVHQGRFGHDKMQYSRVLFTIPDGRGNVFHRNVVNDALNLDCVSFCYDMIDAVNRWYDDKQSESNVIANLPRLVRLHPNGVAPDMVGMPVIT